MKFALCKQEIFVGILMDLFKRTTNINNFLISSFICVQFISIYFAKLAVLIPNIRCGDVSKSISLIHLF